MEKRKNFKEKGITLIALIVTIIVLLILAGVGLNLIMGKEGIIGKTTSAQNKYRNSAAKELLELKIAEIDMDSYEKNKRKATFEEIVEKLDEDPKFIIIDKQIKDEMDQLNNIELPDDLDTLKAIWVCHINYQDVLLSIENNESNNKIEIGLLPSDKIPEDENPDKDNSDDETTTNIARYLLVEVNGYLGNADGAVINELEIYNKNNEKINYIVLKDLEYDTGNNGKSSYWEDINYWNYTNLNDGAYAYTSNSPSGNQNCTLFLYGMNNSPDGWARFIIDLGRQTEIGQIRFLVGGNDELSPCNSRTPKKVSFYAINDFVNGTGENSTYQKNIMQQNNEGLTLVRKKEFDEILFDVTDIELFEDDPNQYTKARYLLVEVNGYFENEDCTVINELAVYNKYNEKINYRVLNDLEYDTENNGKSYYWEDMRYWNYTNLNDGEYVYTSNAPSGNQNGTVFLYSEDNNPNGWARFIIDLETEKKIKQVGIWVGGNDELSPCGSRTPKEVSFYIINDFINGTEESSTYANNVVKRNNNGLSFFTSKTFKEPLTTVTEIRLLKK